MCLRNCERRRFQTPLGREPASTGNAVHNPNAGFIYVSQRFSGETIQMQTLARSLTFSYTGLKARVLIGLAALGIAMCCSSGLAQSGAGSIQGTVTDATGAVIPSAKIHVLNQATDVATDTMSNRVGFYQVPGLFTGSYAVSISAPGMKTNKQMIDLLVGQTAVINATLTAGAVTQQVTVSADTVQLTDTNNGVIS